MGYFIGSFKKTDTGFTGIIETLAFKAQADFHRVLDRTSESHPAFTIYSGDLKIGAAWERNGTREKFLSISFEDPSFSAGYYNLVKSGIEHGYSLYFERPKAKREDKPAAQLAA